MRPEWTTQKTRRNQYAGHWPDWPSSAAAAHSRQRYCAAGPVRPVPDQYALATDEQTSKQTNEYTNRRTSASLCGGGLMKWVNFRFHVLLGTCEASRFDSNSNRTSRFDSILRWRADSKISNPESLQPAACHVCRCTVNNTHCSTTNFNRFGIDTRIYIEFN